jgi:hypothetical protein
MAIIAAVSTTPTFFRIFLFAKSSSRGCRLVITSYFIPDNSTSVARDWSAMIDDANPLKIQAGGFQRN